MQREVKPCMKCGSKERIRNGGKKTRCAVCERVRKENAKLRQPILVAHSREPEKRFDHSACIPGSEMCVECTSLWLEVSRDCHNVITTKVRHGEIFPR